MVFTVAVTTSWEYDDSVLYRPGHLIHRWTDRMEADLHRAIVLAAPINKRANKSQHPSTFGGITPVGHLKANIERSPIARTGTRRLDFEVVSKAAYSAAVIFGTDGGTKAGAAGTQRRDRFGRFASGERGPGEVYRLPFNGPGRGAKAVVRFRGQEPNDFFSKGYAVAKRAHAALG